ncbi:hypothetical protein KIN20_035624 [Parelaphostrongylus tenuis]|uniref:Uncharacterized protein n=1 Tax=Parelaphostrongylus tenuis TaxID=148309 RepID=A0AAD5WJU9_PARTN|nr:hypothetical protein KIN20_035624 [Parelaphostrongylus tenuis]
MDRMVVLSVLVIILWHMTDSAPICRSCSNHCYQSANSTDTGNSTDTELIDDLEQNEIRQKREADVEYRACPRFQVEMLLIPLSIAMIPIVLCALITCTCCCGPKESRGKLPDDFLSSFSKSKKRSQMNSEEMELEFRDGYVQRKDSTRTKFSTVVSYIEARRESLWSLRNNGEAPVSGAETGVDTTPEQAKSPIPVTDQLRKTPSIESIKRTRFSDTVSVISTDSFLRQ